jgi:hypothetical protein
MSLMSAIRAATRGTGRNRLSEEEDDDVMQDDEQEARANEDEDPAAEEDDDTSAEEEDETSAEDDEDDPSAEDDETDEKSMSAHDRRLIAAEQKRIATILTHPGAETFPKLAAKLAFSADHRMPAKKACALLSLDSQSKGKGGKGRLGERMQGKSPKIGAGNGGRQPNDRQLLIAGVRNTISAMHGRKSQEG